MMVLQKADLRVGLLVGKLVVMMDVMMVEMTV